MRRVVLDQGDRRTPGRHVVGGAAHQHAAMPRAEGRGRFGGIQHEGEEERRAVEGKGGPGIRRANEIAARAFRHVLRNRVLPAAPRIIRENADEPAGAAIVPAVLLVADQEPRCVGRIHRKPWLDRGIRIQGAAEDGLLSVHIVGGASRKGITTRDSDQRAEGLSLGGQ